MEKSFYENLNKKTNRDKNRHKSNIKLNSVSDFKEFRDIEVVSALVVQKVNLIGFYY